MDTAKILIVDDSQTIRIALKRIFTGAGYDVIEATDGHEALQLLDQSVSLMVLDVNMPGLDGYGVCDQVRQLGPDYEQFPIVFLTSLETRAMEILGSEFGAYLSKPVDEAELMSTVEGLLAPVSS